VKVLFIGGTGLISTAVSKLAVAKNIDLYLLNRGKRQSTPILGTHLLQADIYQVDEVKEVIRDHFFDVVVEWIAFTVDHVKRDYELFKGKTNQYIFIGTASSYQKPAPFLPITEDVPRDNPYWEYSQNKRDCENYLKAIHDPDFHVTIIRPSHTYDDHSLIFQLTTYSHPYSLLHRMINQQPIVLVGDGSSHWTLTHHEDFAYAFIDILGNHHAYDQDYHLTSDKVYTWNEITSLMYNALDMKPNIIYLPYEHIKKHFPEMEGMLMGDNMHDTIFDNSKIKKVAPHYRSLIELKDRIPKMIAYYQNNESLMQIDESFLKRYDEMIRDYQGKKT